MIKNEEQLKRHLYRGAIHIHTLCSDGSGDLETVVNAAKKAGLDWIIITDHNKMDIKEGIYDGIYVIVGEEISPDDNHYLALGIDSVIEPDDNPQVNVDNVRNQGGFGFAAHPDESPVRKNSARPIRWMDKNIVPDGVEIWNWFSYWADGYSEKNIFQMAWAYFFKHKIVTNIYEQTLVWWDTLNLNNDRIIPAIGGVDAHALKDKKYCVPVTVFSYDCCLKTVTNIIETDTELSEDFSIAKNQILSAIKTGSNLIVNKHICGDIPIIEISNSSGYAKLGDTVKLDDKTFINVYPGKNSEIRIIRNGKVVHREYSKKCKFQVETEGKYRVEIFYKNKGFAYSNPIKIIEQ